MLAPAEEQYVLVALDQRRNGRLPASWHTFLPAVYSISHRWPVRIVVAEGNRMHVDQLLDEAIRRLGTNGYRTTYAPYRSRIELKSRTATAEAPMFDTRERHAPA